MAREPIEPNYGTVHTRLHWVCIKVMTEARRELVEYLKWEGLSWEVRCKWAWYFRYRAALLQIKHPRHEVEMRWGNDPKPNEAELQHANKVRAKKGKITEMENKLRRVRAGWTEMFPIEDHPKYQEFATKLERLKREFIELTS
jgi:hypothetical protein